MAAIRTVSPSEMRTMIAKASAKLDISKESTSTIARAVASFTKLRMVTHVVNYLVIRLTRFYCCFLFFKTKTCVLPSERIRLPPRKEKPRRLRYIPRVHFQIYIQSRVRLRIMKQAAKPQ
jgi:hypothetical protein